MNFPPLKLTPTTPPPPTDKSAFEKAKKMYILGYLGGPDGVFNYQTGPILPSSYPLTHIYVHVIKNETIW